jgi:hypothetical protein
MSIDERSIPSHPGDRVESEDHMTITAKYAGRCTCCGKSITPGQSIEWSKAEGSKHVKCAASAAPTAPIPPDAIALSGGSGYGCEGWTVGQVVRYRTHDTDASKPEWLYVLHASQRYYREDGMSFGVGDDQGRVYWAKCRPATPDEAAPEIARRAQAAGHQAAIARRDEIVRTIRRIGNLLPQEYPAIAATLTDSTRYGEESLRGYGTWIWIGEDRLYVAERIWDDDRLPCWAIPMDAALAAEIRTLPDQARLY